MAFSNAKKSFIALLMTLALGIADGAVNGTCNPSGCSATCSPSCSSGQTCILTTMSDCAVCPASRCISSSVIGLAPTVENKSNNGPMIGGIVGGLLGLGLMLGLGVYCYFKRSKSSGKLPIMFTANSRHSHLFNSSQKETPMSPNPAVIAAISQRTDTSRQSKYDGMNDLQSTTASEPSRSPTVLSQNMAQHQRLSTMIQDNRQSVISAASSDISDLDDHISITSNQTPKSVATIQAVQVTRAKPQIMRVNSVKNTNGINRSGSVRTILTAVEDESAIEDPFKDDDIINNSKQ